jgi:hypothetical protein
MKPKGITYYPSDDSLKFLEGEKSNGISFQFTLEEAVKLYKKTKKKKK